VTELTRDNYLDFAASSRVAVIAFLQPSVSQADRQTFESVAERWRTSFSFGSVDAVESGNGTKASIAVYSQDSDDVVHYQGKFNVNEIEAFLQNATTPLIYEFDPLIHEKLTKVGCIQQPTVNS
jgi:protein disulfide-isomerase A1